MVNFMSGFRQIGSAAGGGSGGSNNQYTIFFEKKGTSSYATGGFQIDLTDAFTTINSLRLAIKTVGSLPAGYYEIALNSPSAGIATVKIMRERYDKLTAVGTIDTQPAGVTVLTASGGTSSSESSHTHAIDHDHAIFTSGLNNSSGGQVLLDATGNNLEQHTHTLNLDAFVGTSGAGSSHNHTDNSIYSHIHSVTTTTTDISPVELANGTNIGTTVWYAMATGIKN